MAGSEAGAGAGGAMGMSGTDGNASTLPFAGPLPMAFPMGPLPDPGYVGCPGFLGCGCLLGGDHTLPWHVCAPTCTEAEQTCDAAPGGTARAQCQLQPVNLLGRRFLPHVEGACVLHCDGGATCPDGLTCVQGGRNTQLCAATGLLAIELDLSGQVPLAPAEPAQLAAPVTQLCGARVEAGELTMSDPTYRRAAHGPSGCILASEETHYQYDLYAYELVGPGPHELIVNTCSPIATFDSVVNVYQDRDGTDTPTDLQAPCDHLLVVADDVVFCDNDGALARITGLAEGIVHVMVIAFGPGTVGPYQLAVESSTSKCP